MAFEAYKNNEFDIIDAAAEDVEVIKADPVLSTEYLAYPGSCTYAVMFHQLKEPFTDQKVREAFAEALDREAWVGDVLNGAGAPTLTWIPPGFPGYDANENRWGFDADAAKKALAESSYGSVDKLPPITATFGDTPRNRTRWEWLAQKWNEGLGVDVKLSPVEPTTFTALTKDITTAPQMFILGWCADYPDEQNWLSVYWKTGGFGERIGYSNAEFDKLVNAADVELRSRQAHSVVRRCAEAVDRRRAGGLYVEQHQRLPGQAVGQGHRDDAAGLRLPGQHRWRDPDRHRHRGHAEVSTWPRQRTDRCRV